MLFYRNFVRVFIMVTVSGHLPHLLHPNHRTVRLITIAFLLELRKTTGGGMVWYTTLESACVRLMPWFFPPLSGFTK